MLSIKRFLAQEADDATSSYLRVLLLFLETAALHAVDFEPAALRRHQSSLRRFREQLEDCDTSADVILVAGEAIKTMEAYNREVERFIRAHGSELQSIVSLLVTLSSKSPQPAKPPARIFAVWKKNSNKPRTSRISDKSRASCP